MMPAGHHSDSDSTLLPLPKSAITWVGGIFARLRENAYLAAGLQLPPQLTERDVLPRFVRTPPPSSGNSDETTRMTSGEVISRPTVERSQSRVEPDMVVPLRRSHRVVKAPDRLEL